MITAYEELIIQRLERYIEKKNITQVELAKKLDWRPQDLNDILKRRRSLGKTRQAHITKKLGISLEINQTSNLNEEDIEIAEMAHHLTKEQKEALKTIIHGLAKEKSKAA